MDKALRQEGFLFLEQRATGGHFNISTRLNAGSTRSPFHLTCILPVSEDILPQSDASPLPIMRPQCGVSHGGFPSLRRNIRSADEWFGRV